MRPGLEMRRIDPYDDGEVRRLHEIAWRAEMEDGRPGNHFWTLGELGVVLREQTEDLERHGYAAFRDGEMVGAGFVQLGMLANTDKAFVTAVVEPERRGAGIGGAVVDWLVQEMHGQGRTQVLSAGVVACAERETTPLLRFADRHGFRLANSELIRTLRLPVAEGVLEGLAGASAAEHAGVSVHSFRDELPEYLPSYCRLLNLLAVDAPTGEIDFEEEKVRPEVQREKLARNLRMGRTTFITLAVRDGEAVAHSDLFVLDTSRRAFQMGTLVRSDSRGLRLGTGVKVANLAALRAHRPDVTEVWTQNADTNRWMVDINDRLGFEVQAVCLELVRDS